MSTDDILRMAIECQLITTGNRDSFYAAALVRFANLVRTESMAEQPARVPLTRQEIDQLWCEYPSDEVGFANAVIAAYEDKNGIGSNQ